jgi:hypothetical protein
MFFNTNVTVADVVRCDNDYVITHNRVFVPNGLKAPEDVVDLDEVFFRFCCVTY